LDRRTARSRQRSCPRPRYDPRPTLSKGKTPLSIGCGDARYHAGLRARHPPSRIRRIVGLAEQ
jgi:hypothetical protein